MSEAMITRRGGGGSARLQTKTATPAASASIVTPDSGYDGLSSVTVAAITPQKEATSYTPGTTDQTIAANQWLAGQQTILGDVNLLAANIKKGVSIFGIAGAYEAGLDTASAILKVVTSTGCSVTVTNGTGTFTQQAGQGFVRPNDANVTEHFFVIPAAAFGTYSVTSTHPTYGNNTKTNAVVIGNAGQVYEVLCGAANIILNSTFGLRSGFSIVYSGASYSEKLKAITINGGAHPIFRNVPIAPYSKLKCSATMVHGSDASQVYIALKETDNAWAFQCYLNGFNNAYTPTTIEASITNKSTDVSVFYISNISAIYEIVLT